MYFLRVFGTPQLRGPSGLISGRVSQRRPLAVLAVLAVAGDGGSTRDQLAGLLWGETIDQRALSELSNALYLIRRQLGADAVIGDAAQLRLNATVIDSDVRAFLAALERRDRVAAVAAYAGPLLEGYHLHRAPAFEEWLGRERGRLAAHYADALEILAKEADAAGDPTAAATWWQRLAAHDPFNSRVAVSLAFALAAARDRVNGLQHLRAHIHLLRGEMQLEPDAEVLAAERKLLAPRESPLAGQPRFTGPAPAGTAGEAVKPEALLAETVGARASAPSAFARTVAWSRPLRAALAVGILAIAAAVGLFLVRGRARSSGLDPNLIAVLPFRVTGTDTLLKELGPQLPDLLWTRLTGEFGPRTTDPAYALQQWKAKGGAVETPLPETRALVIAGAVGASWLIEGSLSGTAARLSVTGSLVEVPRGAVRVPPTTVQGPYDSFPALVDKLTNLLLAADYGAAVHQLPELEAHPTAAVQAYLRGAQASGRAFNADMSEAVGWLTRALELDSTLVLAAVAKYGAVQSDQPTAAYAWTHQSALSPRDRAFLRALAGWRFGATRTAAEKIAQDDSVVQLAPEWLSAVSNLAFDLHVIGAMAGVEDWRARDRSALERTVELDPKNFLAVFQLFELALTEGDTAGARRQATALGALASSRTTRPYAWSARLRLALTEADTTAAAGLWKEGEALLAADRDQEQEVLEPVIGGLLVDARGLRDLDRFVAAALAANPMLGQDHYMMTWARARGRYHEWRSFRDAFYGARDPTIGQRDLDIESAWRIRDALFLGEPEDSSVRAAAEYVDRYARGAVRLPPIAADPTPDAVRSARARCWSTLWHVAHGKVTGARETMRYLREDVPLRYRWSVCAGLIDVLVAEQERGDVRAAVLRLDSIVRPAPEHAWKWGGRDLTVWIDNLLLARLLAQYGEPARALAAARRGRPWETWSTDLSPGVNVDFLREEGRLAATTGDTAGAVWAYDHYLALREDPEPPWRAQRDSVQAELTALRSRR